MASKLDLSKFRNMDTVDEDRDEAVRSEASASAPMPKEPQRPVVTERVVDEAVERVLASTEYSEADKEVFRTLLAQDTDAGFAANYHYGKAEGTAFAAHSRVVRRKVYISQVLTPDETADLVAYAPEFDLRFTDEESHDHAVAAAMRKLDYEIMLEKVPKGISLKDVGADPIYHVKAATPNCHVCNPIEDPKDPSRGGMRHMKAKKIAQDERMPDESRALASRYLEKDGTFCCGKRAQECDHKAKVTISGHVYDVPLEDWPKIMDMAGAVLHEGVVLFPTQAYSSAVGVLPTARARYEIDVQTGRFSMGFINSPSWWYSHKWLDFMRYGVDQIIEYKGARYSYKVTERRGDSIFFQILKVSSVAHIGRQCYRLPGVPMVRVEGYEYTPGVSKGDISGVRAPVQPKIYWFPANLWEDMLQQAEMEFERGVLTYDKLYNYYRTVSARNTINGVLVSGGQKVSQSEIVSLITHVGMCAASSVMLGQRSSRQLTEREMAARVRRDSGPVANVVRSFWGTVKVVAQSMSYYPLLWLCDKISDMVNDALAESLVSWAHEPQFKEVSFSSLVGEKYMASQVGWSYEGPEVGEVFRQRYEHGRRADHLRAVQEAPGLAALITDLCADGLSAAELSSLRQATSVATGADTSGSDTAVNSEQPTGVQEGAPVDESTQTGRRMAIQECIDESRLERDKLEEFCEKVFRACTSASGQPIDRTLRERAEEYYQPDFWMVRNGVLLESALGVDPLECRYSALFTLKLDRVTSSRFRTLQDVVFEPPGGGEVKEYKIITDSSFSGWALSMERLLIYNGPEIQATLEVAMSRAQNYQVELMQGPPGCGKTYALLKRVQHGDVAMCPVRESAADTRARLVVRDRGFPDPKLRVRTVDSYLVNYTSPGTSELVADTLHADETFMSHAGKWYAAAALLGVRRIVAYGDRKQIPHIPRVQARSLYLRIAPDVVVTTYAIYRCPADALAAWGEIYEWRVRTHSSVRHSIRVVTTWKGMSIPDECVMLCMYQADKKELRKVFAAHIKGKGLRIMTTHEAEGKTFDHVWLFRFDTRQRSDKMSLFDQEPHCLVSMSRHKKSFCYVRPKNLNDLIDQWAARSQNPRAIAAMADIESVGKSMQFM
jgi:hypothetical protein